MPVQPTVSPACSASGHSSAPSQARLLSALATLRDALTPDMALNVPAVLDRSALLDLLSVLTTNTPAPTTCDRPSVDLDDLTNGELAVAIHAAGIPANWRTLSVDQVKDMALAGIARLGLDGIRRLDREARALNLQPRTPANVQARRRIWGSGRMAQTATDLAFEVTSRSPRLARAVAR
jgi:hypothetical protein